VAEATASSSENILSRVHWLGDVDARPLALFRIVLGVVLLQDLAGRASTLRTFLTDEGLVPLGSRAAGSDWSLFHVANVPAVVLLFALGVLITLAFTLGWHTRIVTVAAWAFFVSLHRRVQPIMTGGDALADLMLFFGSFVDMGGRFSLDAVRGGARGQVRALAVRFMAYLPGLMYFYTARQKLIEDARGWLGGPILFQHLQLDGWVRPPGVWLGQHPSLCAALAGLTIFVELLLPVLLVLPFWIQPARALAILCNLGLQLGILLTLKVGIFTYVMFAVSALWLQPEWLDAIGGPLSRAASARPLPTWDIPRRWLAASLTIVFFFVSSRWVIGRHIPGVVNRSLDWLGLDLLAGMFTRASPSKRWVARGELSDGRQIDPFSVVAPHAFESGFINSPWMQLPYHLAAYGGIERMVCCRYNAETPGSRLMFWSLSEVARPPYLPSEARARETTRLLFAYACSDVTGKQ
jgi:Vitamin K-dependent gamma-carboxylase